MAHFDVLRRGMVLLILSEILRSTSPAETGTDNGRHLSIIVLAKPDLSVLKAIRTQIGSAGGRALHIFPPAACIAELPTSLIAAFRHDDRISLISETETGEEGDLPVTKIALKAWNVLLRHREAMAKGFYADPKFVLQPSPEAMKAIEDMLSVQSHRQEVSDALALPRSAFDGRSKRSRRTMSGIPYGADFYDTSEFFMGDIVVGILILESNGHDYDWTATDVDQTLNGIVSGMDWWVTGDPRSNRTFTYDIHSHVPISAEPIEGSINDDFTWGAEALTSLGYSTGGAAEQAREYLNDIRSTYETNWATMIFVVDSDPAVNQGNFAGGGYAHAYFGGPWLTMARFSSWAYNSGNYYTCVPAHETGHLFYATDEYDGTPLRSGYFNAFDKDGTECIMNRNSLTRICDSTALQIGWRYSGSDTPDILNVPPVISLEEYLPDPTSVPDPQYKGVATAGVLFNSNPFGQAHGITLNTISGVEYSLDTVNWASTIPADSRWDSSQEHFVFAPPPLLDGTYTFFARASDDLGHHSAVDYDSLTINTAGAVVSTGQLDFGATYVGTPDTLMLSILNNGSDSAHIVGASISNAHFSLPEGSVFSIGAHSRKDVHLVFLPTAAVPEAGTLDFSVLNPGSARLTIRLTGSGVDRPLEVKNPAGIFPEVFALYQNYPNPFNPVTTIRYAVPVGGVVSLKVYDILGTEVATLVEGMQVPGYKSVSWNASSTSSGIYFCRLTAGNFSAVEKLLLIK